MNLKNFSLTRIRQGLKEGVLFALGAHPRKYWPWFLIVALMLFLITISFNIYLFIKLSEIAPPVLPEGFETEGLTINRSALNEVIETIDGRVSRFEDARGAVSPRDPSL